jgi:predicted MFS family arabinose efflux permease
VLYLRLDKGWSEKQALLALSCFGLGAMVGRLGGGWLADRVRLSVILRASFLLQGLCFLILGYLGARYLIYTFMIAIGAVVEAFRPANTAALYSSVRDPSDRARASALDRLAINIGTGIGWFLGSFLVAVVGYKSLFLLDSATSLVAAMLLWRCFHDYPASKQEGRASRGPWPWKDIQFMEFVGLASLFAILVFQLQGTVLLSLANNYHLLPSEIGWLHVLGSTITAVFEMALVHALRDRQPIKVIAWGSFFLGLGFVLLPFGSGLPPRFRLFYVSVVIITWAVGEMLASPLLPTVVKTSAVEGRFGAYLGQYGFFSAFSYAVGPFVGGRALGALGPKWFWCTCGALGMFLCAGFQWFAGRMKRLSQVT